MLHKHLRLYFLVSLVVLFVAILMTIWGFPKIIQKQIQKNVQIDNTSAMFEKWRKLPVPISFKIYVFNVTNPEEVNEGGRPKLAQLGPYVYQEYREKTVLDYGENDTIKYMLQKNFQFDQDASGDLTEDDELTVINLSYMAGILTVQEMMPSLVGVVNEALQELFTNLSDPFLRVRARDLFFDGIYLNCIGESKALSLVCGKIRADAPDTMRPTEDKSGFYFSMFSHMNRTPSGPYEMVRGTEDVHDLGRIVSYKEQRSMRVWRDPYCGQINGTDSTIFPPIDESRVPQRFYTFQPDVCRSMYASLVGKRTLFNMSAYYYEIDATALAAKSANPANKCFCRRNWSVKHDGCLVMGLLNLMPCQDAPVIASLPHFYLASEELLEYFAQGVEPDAELHKTYVYIEPTTGVLLKGVQRLQFNVELRQVKGVPQLENVRTGLFPLLWIEEGATLTEPLIEDIRHAHKLLSYVEAARWLLLCLAAAAAAGCLALLVRAGAVPLLPRAGNSVSFILRSTSVSPDKGQ